ncbi:MAG TPA: hypothetical protein DCK76_06385 [Desulfotomaculum sp.]|nr:MAG: hypothetical protein XD84_0281 [Desulfotomaculum sp. 46_80]HAG11002.1 hypothetical protein [Desulfotomaculum sp.]HBY04877.1 hypothetical protein [Desulfotomaculum sp.]
MASTQAGDGTDRDIKAKVRLDIKGVARPGRFLFGGKTMDKAAEEAREQQVTLLRNVPIQGIHIDDIDLGIEIYTIYEESSGFEVAYAPVILQLTVDSLEDLIRFTMREDFRKVEISSPNALSLHRNDLERLLFAIAEEVRDYRLRFEHTHNLR